MQRPPRDGTRSEPGEGRPDGTDEASGSSSGLPTRSRVGRGPFYRLRVGVLTFVLLLVLAYAARDRAARSARRAWQRPLEVALILLERSDVDPTAREALEARTDALELALEREYRRHGGTFRPIRFRRFGPVPQPEAPPRASPRPGLLEPLRVSWELYRFARESDRAAGLRGAYDGKIYVVLSPPRSSKRALVEGLGQDGGRIAITQLELSEDSVDFGLFVVTHELFHLLGASDRYGPDGSTSIPAGLGEPHRVPLYPQETVEVMARGRVIEPGVEVPPGDLAELRVGPQTAAEIGWRPAPGEP